MEKTREKEKKRKKKGSDVERQKIEVWQEAKWNGEEREKGNEWLKKKKRKKKKKEKIRRDKVRQGGKTGRLI